MIQNQVCFVPVDHIMISPLSDEHALDEGEQVVVAPTKDHHYTLLSGGKVLRESMRDGYTCVQAIVNPSLRLEQRIDRLLAMMVSGKPNAIIEAQSYQELLQGGGISLAELALRVGRSQATIRKKLRLLSLDDEVIEALRNGHICEQQGQELLRLPGAQGQKRVLAHILSKGLSVQATRQLLDHILSRMPIPVSNGRRIKPLMRDYRLYVNAMSGIVEQMTDMGMDATMDVMVGKQVAEVRIVIPYGAKQRPQGLKKG